MKEFCVEDLIRIFKISVQNGRGGGHEERVTSVVIEVNGIQVVGPKEFNNQIEQLTKPINLEEHNEIAVEVRGRPGTSIEVTVSREEQTGTISPGGGTVELEGVGLVVFPAAAFDAPQPVTVFTTKAPETELGQVRWDVSVGPPALPLPFDVRINSGDASPATEFEVALTVPGAFLGSLPPDHTPRVFAQIVQGGSQEDLDHYKVLDSDFDPAANVVRATVLLEAIRPPGPDGVFEVIVIVGSTLTETTSPAPPGGFAQLSAQQACPLPKLSPPLEDELQATDPFNPEHEGIDYRGNGVPVLFAGERGTIRSVGFEVEDPSPRGVELGLTNGGAGQYITVNHDDGSITKYFHLFTGSTSGFAVEDIVTRGEQLGIANATPAGGVTGPHLHFEYLDRLQRPVNPDACTVSVASVTVTPAEATIREGETVQLTAELKDDADSVLTDRAVTWSTSDATVATVDESGLVMGVTEGTATITAAAEGKEGTAAITVELAAEACTASVSAPGATPCGVTVGISPFATGGPFGGFQSTPGTGFQTTITISFSGPVSSVTITALDPDFGGNRMQAFNAEGTLVDEAFFPGDNTPGVFTSSTATVSGSGIVTVLLIPDPLDYIAYTAIQFTTDTGN